MSTTYDGDATNHPTSITIPSDGDDATAASVNVPFEALEDNVDYIIDGDAAFAGIKTFAGQIRRVSTDLVAAFAVTSTPTARQLLAEVVSSATFKLRQYVRATTGVARTGVENVVNAAWNGTKWDFDTTTNNSTNEGARMVEILSTGTDGSADNHTDLAIRRKNCRIMTGSPSDLDFDAGADTITRNSGNWVTDGFEIGDIIQITGTASNNGEHTVTNVAATVLTVGNTLTTESNVNGAGVTIRTAPWSDTGWDSTYLGLSSRKVVPTQGGIKKNTLYPSNMVKAWGKYSTDGAGNVTIENGFGLVSATIVGNNARFTLRNAMVTGYMVQAGSRTTAARCAEGGEISTTVLEVRLFQNASLTSEYNQGSFLSLGSFIVFGEQA